MEIVIALLMWLGDPPILKEHLYVRDQKMSTCLKMKRTAERSGSAIYQCIKANALVKDKHILSISKMDD